MFTGTGTALVTPFRTDGSLDEAALRQLVRRQIDAGIDFLGRANQDQTIGADSEMTVAHCPTQSGRIAGHGAPETIQVDVVVSGALHFGETHGSTLFQFLRDRRLV